MADRSFTVVVRTAMLRRADGLYWGVRVCSPKLFDSLYLLDREDASLHELKPYTVGMLKEGR